MKQSLDYTNPDVEVNFRDVGELINLIAEQDNLPEKRFFRAGTINSIKDLAVI